MLTNIRVLFLRNLIIVRDLLYGIRVEMSVWRRKFSTIPLLPYPAMSISSRDVIEELVSVLVRWKEACPGAPALGKAPQDALPAKVCAVSEPKRPGPATRSAY